MIWAIPNYEASSNNAVVTESGTVRLQQDRELRVFLIYAADINRNQ